MWDFFKILQVMSGQTSLMYCNCIVTRGGVYNEILPGKSRGRALGISRGLRRYFIVVGGCFDLIHIFLGGVDTYFITLGHFSFEYGNFWCFGEVLFPPFSLLTKIKCVLLNGRIPWEICLFFTATLIFSGILSYDLKLIHQTNNPVGVVNPGSLFDRFIKMEIGWWNK